jgi:hypothetical protein
MNTLLVSTLCISCIIAFFVYLQMRDMIHQRPEHVYSRTGLAFVGTFMVVFFISYYMSLRMRDTERMAFENMYGGEPSF